MEDLRWKKCPSMTMRTALHHIQKIPLNMRAVRQASLLRGQCVDRLSMVIVTVALVSCLSCEAAVQTKMKQPFLSKNDAVDVQVTVNTKDIIHVTDKRFLSVAFTIGDLRKHWQDDHLQLRQLHTLGEGLSPSFLRLGGSRANFAFFKQTSLDAEQLKFKNFTFTGGDWDEINNFSRSLGWDLIFDINEFLRTNGQWDPTNFKTLLDYNTAMNYTVPVWQMGNEPNAYQHSEGVTITAPQVAADYIKLRALLNARKQYADALIIGPDVTQPRHLLGFSAVKFLQGFLSKCGDCTNVTTFHSYYLSSRTAKLDDFINPTTLDVLRGEIRAIRNIVRQYRPQSTPRIWLTETGDSVPGGVSGISDRYVGGFPFLDKLGVSAQEGLEAIMKQQFIGRFIGLVNNSNIEPRPAYWVAYLHKKLVGQRVLNVTIDQGGSSLRIYAHCSQTRNSRYRPGDVTILALNLDKTKGIRLSLQGSLAEKTIEEYSLTPYGDDGLHARYVSLNGIKLDLTNDMNLPKLKPHPLVHPSTVMLPPLRYGFYVITGSAVRACM
ncbi:heparanase-like isoform X2 [Acanthaster planci]|uniref:Heparanase-like isoform X2 n=1 Tax=Acanthaster planci TaxID=133434 RepID=A0A8B7XN10_ACAPL|nr:heparanase-like isoform X2 [Acanthaster planci]